MERFDVSPIKINHLAFKLSKSGAHVEVGRARDRAGWPSRKAIARPAEAAPGDNADTLPRSPVMPAHRESPIDPDRLLPILINNLRLFLGKRSINKGLVNGRYQ